jgi:sn-glycerol 3-phosphate transport system substrate-binding protein
MSQVAQDIRWHQGTGYFPLRKTSLQALELEGWFDLHPNYSTAIKQLQETQLITATQGAMMGVFVEARSIILDAVEAVLAGDKSIEDALGEAKATIDQALQDYKDLMGG